MIVTDSVSLHDIPDPVIIGGVLHYTVEVDLSQFAPKDATGVELVMQLPSGVELQSVNTDYGLYDNNLTNAPKSSSVMSK